jgi:erythromycin esterase-like protein
VLGVSSRPWAIRAWTSRQHLDSAGRQHRFGPGATAALLAHNVHVWLEPRRAGGLLRARLGAGYRAVFATFGRGEYNAHAGSRSGAWQPHPCPPPPGSMEHRLDRLEPDAYAVEPASAPALRDELAVRNARMVAVEGADQFEVRCVPAERFDLVVYFRQTHPLRVLARR